MSDTRQYEKDILKGLGSEGGKELQTLFVQFHDALGNEKNKESLDIFKKLQQKLGNLRESVKEDTSKAIDLYLQATEKELQEKNIAITSTKTALQQTKQHIEEVPRRKKWWNKIWKKAKKGEDPRDVISDEIVNEVTTTTKTWKSTAKSWGMTLLGMTGIAGLSLSFIDPAGTSFLSRMHQKISKIGKSLYAWATGENKESKTSGNTNEKVKKNKDIKKGNNATANTEKDIETGIYNHASKELILQRIGLSNQVDMDILQQSFEANDRELFMQATLPVVRELSKKFGVPIEIIYGQAFLESGIGGKRGPNTLSRTYYNFFGIKKGSSRKGGIHKQMDDDPGKSSFRVYRTDDGSPLPELSFYNHARLLARRYNPGSGKDYKTWAHHLIHGERYRYATGKNYDNNLIHIIESSVIPILKHIGYV